MIMDSNGKLFGKISIVDVIVILIIVIAMAGVYFRFFANTGKAVATNSDFYYTMTVKNIRTNSIEALKKSVDTSFELNEKMPSQMGVLIKVEPTPATGIIEKTNGSVVNARIPENFDVNLTFKISGKVNSKGFFTPSLREINTGTTYVIKNKYVSVVGQAIKVWE